MNFKPNELDFFRENILVQFMIWYVLYSVCHILQFYSFDNDSFSLQIMEAFKVAPFDQNLCYHGQYLTDSSQTLGNYLVKRNIKSCFECDYHVYLIANIIFRWTQSTSKVPHIFTGRWTQPRGVCGTWRRMGHAAPWGRIQR